MRTPKTRPRGRRRRGAGVLAALLPLLPAAACCVSPPSADVILDLGFRSPEQTFLTFQTGVRGDLPRLEYACLSADFRARRQLSQLAYREFREEWMRENPWLREGLAEAEIRDRRTLPDGSVALLCCSYGQWFELSLVREDFAQAWSDADLLLDEAIDDRAERLLEEPGEAGSRELVAFTTLPRAAGDAPVTELRVGSEWKIDDLREAEPPPES